MIKQLNNIINEIEWGIERGREIRLSKNDYRMILLVLQNYLEIREEILNQDVAKRELK